MDYCVTAGSSDDSLEPDTIYLIHTSEKKLLYSTAIEENNPDLVRNLRLRMNRVLDRKFTLNYSNVK